MQLCFPWWPCAGCQSPSEDGADVCGNCAAALEAALLLAIPAIKERLEEIDRMQEPSPGLYDAVIEAAAPVAPLGATGVVHYKKH